MPYTCDDFARMVAPRIANNKLPSQLVLDAAKLGVAEALVGGVAGARAMLETGQIETAKGILRELDRILQMPLADVMRHYLPPTQVNYTPPAPSAPEWRDPDFPPE